MEAVRAIARTKSCYIRSADNRQGIPLFLRFVEARRRESASSRYEARGNKQNRSNPMGKMERTKDAGKRRDRPVDLFEITEMESAVAVSALAHLDARIARV